ncbi:MAG TPA: MFS transporter [Sphaerochaeta sp.]|jgi:PPP family 3-phenylpropionic acid transporter|nr:MFS transporter [Sphaerochaeta sp.]
MLNLSLSFFFVYCIVAVISPYLQVMIHNLGYSYEVVGALLSLYEIAAIFGPMLVALWIDRSGRMKSSVLVCTVISMAAMGLLMTSSSIIMVIGALTLFALTFRSIMPAMDSYTNNRYDGNSRSYSLVRSVGTVGFILLSLFFAATGLPDLRRNSAIGLWAIASSFLFLLTVIAWKDEPKRALVLTTDLGKGGRWYDRAFVVGMVIIALNRLSLTAVTSFLSLFLVEELGINAISLMNAIGAASEFFAMIGAGILLQKKRVLPYHLFAASSLAMVIRLLIYAFFPTVSGVLVGQLLHSVGYGAFQPAAIFFVARRVKRHRRTLGMSIYASLGTGLPAVVGSALGGFIVQHYGYRTLFSRYALFALASLLLTLIFSKTMRQEPLEAV